MHENVLHSYTYCKIIWIRQKPINQEKNTILLIQNNAINSDIYQLYNRCQHLNKIFFRQNRKSLLSSKDVYLICMHQFMLRYATSISLNNQTDNHLSAHSFSWHCLVVILTIRIFVISMLNVKKIYFPLCRMCYRLRISFISKWLYK